MGKSNQSAIARLRQLPYVFDLRDLRTTFELGKGIDRVLVSRWRDASLIEPVGPNAGLYYNLVRDPDGAKQRIGEAIRRRFPAAVVIGSSAIHAGGWTTQIPRRISVAVPSESYGAQMTGVRLLNRSRTWYARIQPGLHLTEEEMIDRIGLRATAAATDPMIRIGMDGLPTLHPAWALADQLRYKDDWVPDPDDLDNQAVDREQDELKAAYKALNVKVPKEYRPAELAEGLGPRI